MPIKYAVNSRRQNRVKKQNPPPQPEYLMVDSSSSDSSDVEKTDIEESNHSDTLSSNSIIAEKSNTDSKTLTSSKKNNLNSSNGGGNDSSKTNIKKITPTLLQSSNSNPPRNPQKTDSSSKNLKNERIMKKKEIISSDEDDDAETEMITETDTPESSYSEYTDEESDDETPVKNKNNSTKKKVNDNKKKNSNKREVSESEDESDEATEEEYTKKRPVRKAAKKAMKKIRRQNKSKKENDFENMIENLIKKYTNLDDDEEDDEDNDSETSSSSEDENTKRKNRRHKRKYKHSTKNKHHHSKKYEDTESETEDSDTDDEPFEKIRFIISKGLKKNKWQDEDDEDEDDEEDDEEEEEEDGGFMSFFGGGKPKNPYDLKLPISKMTPELVEYLKKMPNILGSVPKPGDDIKQFRKMDSKQQKTIVESLKQMHDHYKTDEHPYFRILRLPIDAESKRNALEKQMQIMKSEQMGYEDSTNNKLQSWLHSFLKIPFGIYTKFPKTAMRHPAKYLLKASQTLDKEVYGMDDAKDHLLRYVAQLITNPTAAGNCLAMLGPPGTGKTSLIKEALGRILNRPVHMIALGGNTDAAVLEGHSYTYEGSVCGQIADILIRSHCMNPVIIFDELDKVSSTQKGDEIIGLLTHITDSTQNTGFQDKYFAGINIDLSRVLFVFTMNDRSVVNKVLLDRLRVITTKGYSSREKRIIGDEYLLPKIMKEYGFDSLKISDDAWKYIMNGRSEPGVRNVKRDLETIISRLNIYRLCMRDKSFVVPTASEASASASSSSSKGKDKEKETTRLKGIPTNISWKDGDALGEEDVKILLGNRDDGVDKPPPGMYA